MERAELTMNDEACSTRKHTVYVDTVFTGKYGKLATGKSLACIMEPGSSHDRNTMAIEKDR